MENLSYSSILNNGSSNLILNPDLYSSVEKERNMVQNTGIIDNGLDTLSASNEVSMNNMYNTTKNNNITQEATKPSVTLKYYIDTENNTDEKLYEYEYVNEYNNRPVLGEDNDLYTIGDKHFYDINTTSLLNYIDENKLKNNSKKLEQKVRFLDNKLNENFVDCNNEEDNEKDLVDEELINDNELPTVEAKEELKPKFLNIILLLVLLLLLLFLILGSIYLIKIFKKYM